MQPPACHLAEHLEALRKGIPLVNPKDAKIEELLKENEELKHRNAKIEELLKEYEKFKMSGWPIKNVDPKAQVHFIFVS